ncbi:hypothetical protein GCM10027403_12560 [Arthrobacter tecti]
MASTDENCRLFYRLLAETAAGQFQIRSEEYYRAFWQDHQSVGSGQMFFAYSGDRVVAAVFVLLLGRKASRKDAASVRERPVRGASALLEIEVITWLKQQNATEYDLCGTPPAAEADDRSHALYGVGAFMRGFQPAITDYVGTWDYPIQPARYALWTRAAERITLGLHRRRTGENYY